MTVKKATKKDKDRAKPVKKTGELKSGLAKEAPDSVVEVPNSVTISQSTIKLMQENIIIHDILLRTLLTTDPESVDFIMAHFLSTINFQFVVAAQGMSKEFENTDEVIKHACDSITKLVIEIVQQLKNK